MAKDIDFGKIEILFDEETDSLVLKIPNGDALRSYFAASGVCLDSLDGNFTTSYGAIVAFDNAKAVVSFPFSMFEAAFEFADIFETNRARLFNTARDKIRLGIAVIEGVLIVDSANQHASNFGLGAFQRHKLCALVLSPI
ncbi:MAG: hypothetical protein FWD87_11245 [Spirochaetaceae bacterium]|nr:hypothetical protein [Spirochaetaceae bacterium]